METQELNRVTQYVTARTSYSREAVEDIIQTGMQEITTLAKTSSQSFERPHLMEYICQWTISRTGQPEPMVREILECAGRWLDDLCREFDQENSEGVGQAEQN